MQVILSDKFELGLLYLTLAGYLLAAVLYWLRFFIKNDLLLRFANAIAITGLTGNGLILIVRVVRFGQFTLINSYEFLLLFSGFTVLFGLMLILRNQLRIIGAFVLPIAGGLLLYALLLIQQNTVNYSQIPIYRSPWLTGYTLASALSYSAFAVSFGFGMMFLVKEYLARTASKGVYYQELPSLDTLDDVGYRLLSIAFPFFSASIILGAVWANLAWGSYWSWAAKETWSLISWLAYIAYFHARMLHGWRGNRSAWMAVMGFLAIVFTFFGVTYFLPGQNILSG
ncbi:MAG TPA: c-type cytochrome biogenesis protein CcsB [Desulfobacteria bacterium]|nr:c-type cytochrome biogenesis protein CcsB [Desulfobacteria bacterium]